MSSPLSACPSPSLPPPARLVFSAPASDLGVYGLLFIRDYLQLLYSSLKVQATELFGFQVSGFGFQSSGFGFRVSGLGFRGPGERFVLCKATICKATH